MHARVRNSRSSCFSSTTDQKSEDGATRAKGKGEKKSSCECQRLDAFLPPKKKASECDEFEEIDCTSLEPSNEQAAEGLQKPATPLSGSSSSEFVRSSLWFRQPPR